MDLSDILLVLAPLCLAVVVLYRSIIKKKWCPGIFGSGSCRTEEPDGHEEPGDNGDGSRTNS